MKSASYLKPRKFDAEISGGLTKRLNLSVVFLIGDMGTSQRYIQYPPNRPCRWQPKQRLLNSYYYFTFHASLASWTQSYHTTSY